MAKIVYQGKEYHSSSALVKELYESGKLENTVHAKKELAKELDIAVQSVHAALLKVVGENANKVRSVSRKGKVLQAVVVHEGEEVEGVSGKRIRVDYAPNIWGLPITDPPTYVIDKNYKGDTYLPDEESLNSTSELLTY